MSAQVIRFPDRHIDGKVWEPWINEDTLARHFGVSVSTVRRWRRSGMPSALFGGSRRFRISDAESWHRTRRTA